LECVIICNFHRQEGSVFIELGYCHKVPQAKLVQYPPQSHEHPARLEKKRFFRQTSSDSHLIYYASLCIFV